LISQKGIKATVETVSNDELLKRYRDADLFVHCGMIELEGMSVVEAMAMGNAVLVSDSIDSAANVFALDDRAKFKAGDAKDLSLKLDYLINHSSERMLLANKNRNFIQAYRHETCVAKLLGLYIALAEQSNDGLVD
jgi:glycosyltransferase involved in cell wall biosynthesis